MTQAPARALSPCAQDSDATTARIVDDMVVYDGYNRLRRVALQLPDGALVERHIEDHGRAVTVLPYDPERRTALLVSMPRAAVIDAGEDDLLEAVAGSLGTEDPAACARREALEEAGVVLRDLQPVSVVWSMPTLSLERIHLFLARYSWPDRVASGGGADGENENITVHELSLHALAQRCAAGSIADLKTLALIQALQLRHPDLFVESARWGEPQ